MHVCVVSLCSTKAESTTRELDRHNALAAFTRADDRCDNFVGGAHARRVDRVHLARGRGSRTMARSGQGRIAFNQIRHGCHAEDTSTEGKTTEQTRRDATDVCTWKPGCTPSDAACEPGLTVTTQASSSNRARDGYSYWWFRETILM